MKEAFRVLFTASVLFLLAGISAEARTRTQTINLPADLSNVVFDDDDSDNPEVTARVGRISFISGDARIKRADSADWEKVQVNMPLVEGDEIATDDNGRVEIQFSSKLHLRLDHNSYLRFTTVADTGIALSLSQGTISVRARDFDKAKGYIEIDAPKTTIAIQKSGAYRVDAGTRGDNTIRVAATEGGEARVYSDDAGFTLKSGRVASVFTDGARAGEWDTSDVAAVSDGFDQWTADRDSAVAKRLSNAHYGRFYDDDIFGADDLNDNGEWINTASYGYVWRPYSSAIGGYSNWSPYRYGQWSWVPPYGWVWVNDEPWGWATYHYGRWVSVNGSWVWSPYGYKRPKRSWWFPALVVINVVATNIYWYPLPYHHDYCNFNWNYHHRGRDRDRDRGGRGDGNGGRGGGPGGNGNPGGRPGPRPVPSPGGTPPQGTADRGRGRNGRPDGVRNPPGGVPPGAVIGVEVEDFATRGRFRPVEGTVAKRLVDQGSETAAEIKMPEYEKVAARVKREMGASPPIVSTVGRPTTGAGERRGGASLDQELRKTRIFGGRPPTGGVENTTGVPAQAGQPATERKTGAVERPAPKPPVMESSADPTTRPTGRRSPPIVGNGDRKADPPVMVGPPQTGNPGVVNMPPQNDRVESKPPREVPRPRPVERQPQPRSEPPPTERPKSDPPVRTETPVRERPRNDPPPQRQPEPRRETPPPKETPKSEPPKSTPKTDNPPPRKRDGE